MRALVLTAVLLLAACSAEPEEGALTSDEEQQLNDAAAMLDEPADEGEAEADAGADNEAGE